MPSVIVCQTLKSRRSKRGYACDDDALMVSNSYGSFATMRPFGIARCCTAIEFVSFVSERTPRNAQGGITCSPSAKLRGVVLSGSVLSHPRHSGVVVYSM